MILCDPTKRILAIGHAYVDRHLDQSLVRLGGVFHVARALHALRAEYSVAYFAPDYLEDHCRKFFHDLNVTLCCKAGTVTGAPNVLEISDSTEAGPQGYIDLLRQSRHVSFDSVSVLQMIREYGPTDVLILPVEYTSELIEIFAQSPARLHIDADHTDYSSWDSSGAITTVFCSTSGQRFRRTNGSVSDLKCKQLTILKENRGGSRMIAPESRAGIIEAPAYPATTAHSVGVGDCFDAVWIAQCQDICPERRLRLASYVAALYASTFDFDEFVGNVQVVATIADEVLRLQGVRMPWEDRPKKRIYIAAPDFPGIDTSILDTLETALRYHNFDVARPIRENGLDNLTLSPRDRRAIYNRDIDLLTSCHLLIAVPICNDPGTFVELGWFAKSGKASILFDKDKLVDNLFAINAPSRVCRTLSAVVDSTFELLGAQ